MEICGLKNSTNSRTVVVLGAFDGIHRGHRSLIEKGKILARQKNAKLALMTFAEHPDTIFKKFEPKFLTTHAEKMEIFRNLGVEIVFLPHFLELVDLSARDFFYDILLKKFNAVGAVAGPNFRFGKKAKGNSEYLAFLGHRNGFPIIIGDYIKYQNRVISSTMIRRMLKGGDVVTANLLLGRRYRLGGEVVFGEGRGKKLKRPTANIAVPEEKLIPACGVYFIEGFCESKTYLGLLSISAKPTFHDKGEIAVEAYFFGSDDDLYGKHLQVDLVRYQRGIVKYKNADELSKQVSFDIKNALRFSKYYLRRG